MKRENLNDKSIWDEIYRKTGNRPGWDRPGADPNLYELIIKHGPAPSPRLLDVGCGNGRNVPVAHMAGALYTGTDFSESAILYCRELYEGRTFYLQDICQPLRGTELGGEKPFDIVMDCGCFHAIPPRSRKAYIDNIKSLCRSGGVLIVGSWFRENEVDREAPQYFPYLYLNEWFFNDRDIREFFGESFDLVETRIDREIYGDVDEAFAYFAMVKK
ncbi:MAG: class I SAM-dependent methyltransferase [Spirochaetales bacterium]|nr:class I SAM-dependent methyltransferase [Spirochaetales bacterium]